MAVPSSRRVSAATTSSRPYGGMNRKSAATIRVPAAAARNTRNVMGRNRPATRDAPIPAPVIGTLRGAELDIAGRHTSAFSVSGGGMNEIKSVDELKELWARVPRDDGIEPLPTAL